MSTCDAEATTLTALQTAKAMYFSTMSGQPRMKISPLHHVPALTVLRSTSYMRIQAAVGWPAALPDLTTIRKAQALTK